MNFLNEAPNKAHKLMHGRFTNEAKNAKNKKATI
jgi:hypothetical protein